MNLIKVSDLFEVKYGVNLELINLNESPQKSEGVVCFVSRTENNNGVSAFVKKVEDVKPISAGTLTVAGGGSVLATFLQPYEYYSGRDLFYLTPKRKMSEREMMYYSICIKRNKYRYSYNRQANKTLRDLFIPAKVPDEFLKLRIDELSSKSVSNNKLSLFGHEWKWFSCGHLFDLSTDPFVSIDEARKVPGKYPFISTGSVDNGIACMTGIEKAKVYPRGCITVASSGSAGEAFYQEKPFKVTNMITILKPKFTINVYTGLFLVTLIRKEKYRYSYGRKSGIERMKESKIKLPVAKNGQPDWQFMEDYIKSLAYSASI